MQKEILSLIHKKNNKIKLFTPGPSSLVYENLHSLEPCFGRGDLQYDKIEKEVLKNILKISGHKHIARLQGAASLALEIMILNYIQGKVLIIQTGVYSKKKYNKIKNIDYINHKNLNDIYKSYDWIMACPVETSVGFKIPISDLNKLKKKCKAQLALDATASIGLEKGHYLSDIAAFSSCKGLFGLTGGAFITFNRKAQNEIHEFNLNIENHLNKKMTGPYHAKNMNQPNLCTLVKKKVHKKNKSVVLYESRADIIGSVVCHLGEVHLKNKAKGEILKNIYFKK
jgi:aspartate aminotransferase-like enzyme